MTHFWEKNMVVRCWVSYLYSYHIKAPHHSVGCLYISCSKKDLMAEVVNGVPVGLQSRASMGFARARWKSRIAAFSGPSIPTKPQRESSPSVAALPGGEVGFGCSVISGCGFASYLYNIMCQKALLIIMLLYKNTKLIQECRLWVLTA